jgi:two-component system, LytTR family, response regulator
MKQLSVLVIEDEGLAAEAVRKLLQRDSEIDVAGVARDGLTAVSLIRRLKPDIVFLDIQIPELDAFGVIHEIGPMNMPVIIFVTAYDRYTLQAFEVHAADYLLKPFDEERFFGALSWAKREVRLRDNAQPRQPSSMREPSGQGKRRFPIKLGGRILFIDLESIDYLEAAGNYVVLHAGGKEYRMRETMNALEEKLSSGEFIRIHRSAIVNRKRIHELRPWITGEYVVVMTSGKELTLTRSYRDRLPLLLAGE